MEQITKLDLWKKINLSQHEFGVGYDEASNIIE